MKTIKIYIAITLLSFACVSTSLAQEMTASDSVSFSQRMQEKISQLLTNEMFCSSQVGLMVYDLDADSTLFAYNEMQQMRPASTMKLLTAITALKHLGEKYRLRTTVYTHGECENTTLHGDLYVKGRMDPTFSQYDMTEIVNAVKEMKVDTISGELIADLSFKDGDRLGEGWCWDDDNPVLSPLLHKRKDNFLEDLRVRLDEAGIAVVGRDSVGKTPAEALKLVEVTTELAVVLTKMMKESDNLYAESMLCQIGGIGGEKSSAKRAQTYEKRLIKEAGAKSDYRLADGSGLSLYNYLTPELEVMLLRYAYKDKNIFRPLCQSLPIAGVDGTLKKRMKGTAAEGNIKAKTGTVTGVSSLAGYATSPEGHMLAFCIINQGIMKTAPAREFQDKVCQAICE